MRSLARAAPAAPLQPRRSSRAGQGSATPRRGLLEVMSDEIPIELAIELSRREMVRAAREEQERRERAFAYLATLAVMCLRGDASLGEPKPIGEANGGSYITCIANGPLKSFGLPNTHVLRLSTNVDVVFAKCDAAQIAEALLLEVAQRRPPCPGDPSACRCPQHLPHPRCACASGCPVHG